MDHLFEIKNLSCSYDRSSGEAAGRIVLRIDNLTLPRGEKIFIVGESGIGKSTILEVLGLMNNTIVLRPETVFRFYEKAGAPPVDLLKLWETSNDRALSAFRLRHFSFIFQNTNLMRNFTAFENIAFTRMLQGYSAETSYEKASRILSDLGLPQVGQERMAQELSGGQQQRLAFARAILPDFTVLFGDEPTGNLDGENASRVMELLSQKLTLLKGSSAIIVSHDMALAISFADRIIKIRKEFQPAPYSPEEQVPLGVIDQECMYTPQQDTFSLRKWTNGKASYTDAEFEWFLKNTNHESE